MARIRYSELPVGLHVTAVAVGRHTTIYLQPGLTAAERKSALLRVRSSARIGHGPSLSAFALAKAAAADRLRAAMLTLAAAIRRHPVLLAPAAALVLSVAVLAVVSGTAVATHGRSAGPEPNVAGSVPVDWHWFESNPEPLVLTHHRLKIRDEHHHRSRRRGRSAQFQWASRASSRPGSPSLTRWLMPDMSSHHQPGY